MTEDQKTIQKLQIVVGNYQQKLANSDLATASAEADLQILRQELAEKDQRIIELQEAAKPKTASKAS